MSRFVGMVIVIGGLLAALVGLSAAFYLLAGALASLFHALGAPPQWGAAIANTLTLLLVVVMISATLLTIAERKWSAAIQNRSYLMSWSPSRAASASRQTAACTWRRASVHRGKAKTRSSYSIVTRRRADGACSTTPS